MRARTNGPWLLAALTLAGCGNEFGIRDQGDEGDINLGSITVEPRRLDFPAITSRDFVTQTVTITNDGLAGLSIDDLQFLPTDDEAEASYTVEPSTDAPLVLPSGESMTVDVTFQPTVGGDLTAELLILTDAQNTDEVIVPISGIGQMPRLVVDPDPLDFGSAFIPCDEDRTVTIKNLGPEPAVIDDVYLTGDGADMLTLTSPLPSPLQLFENQQQFATIRLTPSRKVRFRAALALDGNDPRGVVEGEILGESVFITENTDTFDIPDRFPVDLVFAVDQSGSMQQRAAAVRAQFETFLQQLGNATLDWRVGVFTHDRGGSSTGCFTGGTSGAITQVGNWQSTLRTALFPGASANDPLTEALLAGVELGLDRAVSGDCNAAFGQGRSPTQPPPLHIIVVSNERDQSEFPEVEAILGRGVANDGTARATDFVAAYRSWAGANAEVKVHGIIDLDFEPAADNTDCGGVYDGPEGYQQAVAQTGGYLLDVCSSSTWAASFADITTDVIQGAQALRLSLPDVWPDSVQVQVDGRVENDGWFFDAARNAVVFDDPPRGATVEVSYGVAAQCN